MATPPSDGALYGYARVSTLDQVENGVSLDEQRRRIEGRCMEEGWRLSEMFIEKGIPGSMPLAQRPEGGRMLGMLKPGDIVVAAKLDRVFRSARDALNVIEDLRSRKVSLWMLDVGDCSGNGISQLVITIMAAVADFERDRIGQRIREGKTQLRHEGRHQGGARPFGCSIDESTEDRWLVPIAEEQAAIADMVALRAEGASLMAIRDEMRGSRLRDQPRDGAKVPAALPLIGRAARGVPGGSLGAQGRTGMRNYIVDHWCGRLGLARFLFLNGVAISVLLIVVVGVIESRWPRPEFIWVWLVVFVVWLIWACVGIFRCGARYLLDRENGVACRVGGYRGRGRIRVGRNSGFA
jgi:putative DNA-invertase from lambdoid prophage Rac